MTGRVHRLATPGTAPRCVAASTEQAHYEADPGAADAEDLEQDVWVRLLETGHTPAEPAGWLAAQVRAAALAAEARGACEGPYADRAAGPPPRAGQGRHNVEERAEAAVALRALLAAVPALPGDCPRLLAVLMSGSDPTYREISRELGISQGSVGPLRSRCLGCLRSILNSRVGSPVGRGNAR
ncbi:sigma-70 family RNA polymerase sigma factor [Streptomyces sp. NRRL F-5123]|uniref:sigma-70 family RNA polymerase sigma factor n=1 Tax=Streptomyces sp. NRRL F-5123 TaxID=1463856 RepID=UPI0007C5B45E|nr:sigma-70 family RNA polymerase sigma factor [Streptomyces sp. NRRL F-5123]